MHEACEAHEARASSKWLYGCFWRSDGMAKGLYSCGPLVDVETVVVLSGKGKIEFIICP